MTARLRRDGGSVNAQRVRRGRRELGWAAEPPPRRVRTPDRNHPFPGDPKLVADRTATRPHPVWVADRTAVGVQSEFESRAVRLDVCIRAIGGGAWSRALDQGRTRTALRRAVRRGRPGSQPSDQGRRTRPPPPSSH